MMSSTNRAERLLDLVSLFLGAEQPISWAELVESFPSDYGKGSPEAAQRKWERDKAALVELGVPLVWIRGGSDSPEGYRIDREKYYMRDLDLAPEERALLSVAGAAALEQPDFPLRSDLAHALDKLLFEARGASGTPNVPRLVVHLPSTGAERQSGVLEQLGQALAARKEVEFHYRAFGGQSTERRVAPYGLAYRRGAWFLVARCYLRAALRIFQVERIAELKVNPDRPKIPDFAVPDDFDLRAAIGREPWEFAVHPAVEVRLRLDPEVALLAKSRFGEKARMESAEDGAAIVRFPVTYGEAIVREVLRLAPHAELLEPADLRKRVADASKRIAELHEGEGGTPRALRTGAATEDHGASEAVRGSTPARGPGDLQERLRRALFLIPYVVANPGCTVEELASAGRLTPEQLLTELDFLRMIGRPPFSPADLVDIDVFDGRVHVTLPQGLSRPPSLTPLEAAALDAAASALEVEGGSALARARAKLRAALPPERQEQFDSVAGRVRVEPGGLDAVLAAAVDRAIAERKELEITYWTASRGEAGRRRLRPLERVLHQGYWYLHAYCCDRRDRRLFRLDRAVDPAVSDRSFVPRAIDDAARFRRESIYLPGPEARIASVRIAKGSWAVEEQARRLGATDFVLLPDGEAEAAFPVEGDAWLPATVLSLGGDAEVFSPPEIRRRVAELAGEVMRRHASP